ncbi:MAG: hypothetical protein ACFFAL_08355 [Promethearchaeota archaeon]
MHTDQEAIAVCQACGIALCSDCRITIAGIGHCQSCIDARRIHLPANIAAEPDDHLPTPLGNVTRTSRRNLLIGTLGMVLSAIFFHSQWLFPSNLFFLFDTPNFTILIPRTVGTVLVALGICLSAFAWNEFGNYFNFRWSFHFALFTVLAPLWSVLVDLLNYSGLVYVQTQPGGIWEPGPLTPIVNNLNLANVIFVGFLVLLWAAALLSVKKNSRSPKLTLGASIIYLIWAHIMFLTIPSMVPYYIYSPISILLTGYNFITLAFILEIGVILNAVFFYRLAASLKSY